MVQSYCLKLSCHFQTCLFMQINNIKISITKLNVYVIQKKGGYCSYRPFCPLRNKWQGVKRLSHTQDESLSPPFSFTKIMIKAIQSNSTTNACLLINYSKLTTYIKALLHLIIHLIRSPVFGERLFVNEWRNPTDYQPDVTSKLAHSYTNIKVTTTRSKEDVKQNHV